MPEHDLDTAKCQHGNPEKECTIVCGVNFCKHLCNEHELYEPDPDEVVDEAACWTLGRNCLLTDCTCGIFLNPATEAEARMVGKACGKHMVEMFLKPENRGINFDWRAMEKYVKEWSLDQWKLSARYGLEEFVKEEAVRVWRQGELLWDEEDAESFWKTG